MLKIPITVTVLTKNSEKYIGEVLSPLSAFDEVLVFDTGSVDQTVERARAFFNVVVFERPFRGFGPTHNEASSLAKNDWILSIDSDEIASLELIEEIKALPLERGAVYSIARRNEYRGKWIRHCGWAPDRQIKLYHRQETSFTEAEVHEAIKAEGMRVIPLNGYLKHYSYGNAADFLQKMQIYSSLFAKQYQGKRRSSLSKAIGHGCFSFFKTFVLKRGFLDGREGFEISFYNGATAFYKYLKLAEANEKLAQESACDRKKTRDI